MADQGIRVRGFEFKLRCAESAVFELEWSGHLGLDAMRACCAEIERAVERCDLYSLVVDARGLASYDPDARAYAVRWSRSAAAMRAVAVLVIADSQLAAAESPATALAPLRRAHIFGSPGAARRYLMQRSLGASGEYPRAVLQDTVTRAASRPR